MEAIRTMLKDYFHGLEPHEVRRLIELTKKYWHPICNDRTKTSYQIQEILRKAEVSDVQTLDS